MVTNETREEYLMFGKTPNYQQSTRNHAATAADKLRYPCLGWIHTSCTQCDVFFVPSDPFTKD
jgi:hypothetical protein